MPRAQSGGIVTGGAMPQSVVQSGQQGRQAADNRLVSAMQQKAATKRTAMTNEANLAQTSIQAAAQIQAQSMRNAEVREGRRIDNEARMALTKQEQEFAKNMFNLQKESEAATKAEDWKKAKELTHQMDMHENLRSLIKMEGNRGLIKAITRQAENRKNDAEVKQHFNESAIDNEREFERQNGAYNQVIDETSSRVTDSGRVNYDVGIEALPEKVFNAFPMTTALGMPSPIRKTTAAALSAIAQAGPSQQLSSVVDDEFKMVQVPGVTSQMFEEKNIHQIEKMIAKGELEEGDVLPILGVLEGTVRGLDQKIEATKDKDAKNFYTSARYNFDLKARRFKDLDYSTEPVGKTGRTVGSVMSAGLKHLKPATPSQLAQRKAEMEARLTNTFDMVADFSESIMPGAPNLSRVPVEWINDPYFMDIFGMYSQMVTDPNQSAPTGQPTRGLTVPGREKYMGEGVISYGD